MIFYCYHISDGQEVSMYHQLNPDDLNSEQFRVLLITKPSLREGVNSVNHLQFIKKNISGESVR